MIWGSRGMFRLKFFKGSEVFQVLLSKGATESSDAASLIPARTFPSSSLAEINLILFSMALQIGNVACVLGSVSARDAFEEIFTFSLFFKPLYRCIFQNFFFRSTEILAGMSILLVVFLLLRLWLVWGSLLSLQTTGVCLPPPPNMMIHMSLD